MAGAQVQPGKEKSSEGQWGSAYGRVLGMDPGSSDAQQAAKSTGSADTFTFIDETDTAQAGPGLRARVRSLLADQAGVVNEARAMAAQKANDVSLQTVRRGRTLAAALQAGTEAAETDVGVRRVRAMSSWLEAVQSDLNSYKSDMAASRRLLGLAGSDMQSAVARSMSDTRFIDAGIAEMLAEVEARAHAMQRALSHTAMINTGFPAAVGGGGARRLQQLNTATSSSTLASIAAQIQTALSAHNLSVTAVTSTSINVQQVLLSTILSMASTMTSTTAKLAAQGTRAETIIGNVLGDKQVVRARGSVLVRMGAQLLC